MSTTNWVLHQAPSSINIIWQSQTLKYKIKFITKYQFHWQQAVSFKVTTTFTFCFSQCTILSTPYITCTWCMLISTANLYGLAVHMTCCIYNDFPLSCLLSTPIFALCSVHSTYHRPQHNISKSITTLQLINNNIIHNATYHPINNLCNITSCRHSHHYNFKGAQLQH